MDFSDKVEALFKKTELTQKAFAEKAGITPAALNAILKRKTSSISVATARKIADTYSVTFDYLMRDDVTDPNYGRRSEVEPTYAEGEHLKKYRFIDQEARNNVDNTLNFEYDRAIKKEQAEEYLYDPPEGIVDVLMSDEQGNPIRRKLTLEEYQFLERLAKEQKEEASSA